MTDKRATSPTAFTDLTNRKRWTGSAWVNLTVGERWTGSAWVDVFPGAIDPNLPVAAWVNPNTQETAYYDCVDVQGQPSVCPTTVTFNVSRDFTVTGEDSIVLPPVSGVTSSIVGNTLNCSVTISRRQNVGFKIPIHFINTFGTTVLQFHWQCFYDYVKEFPGEPP